MNPELNKKSDEDTSAQLPINPVIEAKPEETYTEPEITEATQESSPILQPAPGGPAHGQELPKNLNQGKALAITGIILAILPFQFFGLIFSIAAKIRAYKGTSANNLAIIGIVLNIIFGLIVAGIFVAIALTAQAGILERIEEQKAVAQVREPQSNISPQELRSNVMKANLAAVHASATAYAYSAQEGKYPTSASQLQTITPLEIVSTESLGDEPENPSIVEYAICDSGAAFRIGIWNYATNRANYRLYPEEYIPPTDPNCSVVAQIFDKNKADMESEPRAGI